MRVLVADEDVRMDLPDRLQSAGWTLSRDLDRARTASDIVVVGIGIAQDPVRVRELRKRIGGPPLVVIAHVPLPALHEIGEHVAALVLPAFTGPRSRDHAIGCPTPRLVPVTTFGPTEGLPRRFHRQALRALRAAGIPVSLRSDMQAWLTSAAAWMAPLRGAMHVATACGSDLRLAPGLAALAARAGRERIGLMRRAGLRLESRARWLSATSESLAIGAFGRLAGYADGARAAEWLPGMAEVVVASRHFARLRDEHRGSTPAADALDSLVLELATRGGGIGAPPATRQPRSPSVQDLGEDPGRAILCRADAARDGDVPKASTVEPGDASDSGP